ncbi:hypothetical protein HAX54_004863, partial [Datura stramonium]|nr:hypothetical protein [Datura stramonium]
NGETIDEVYLKEEEEEDQAHLGPPYNLMTPEERISWFKKKLPNFEIMKSTKTSRKFNISRTLDSPSGIMIFRPLVELGYRILAVTPDLCLLFENTPAASWFIDLKNGKKDPGKVPLAQNLSNLMRLAVLYKYGGVYRISFIILKKFFKIEEFNWCTKHGCKWELDKIE